MAVKFIQRLGGTVHVPLNDPLMSIVSVDLRGTNVKDADLKHLTSLCFLRRLNLRDTGVTDSGIKDLISCRNLQVLDLRGTKVTDPGLDELRKALPKCDIFPRGKRSA
jgi:hypothetical protein